MNENNDNGIKTMVIVTCMLLIATAFSSVVTAEKQSDYKSKEPIQDYTTFKGMSQTLSREICNLPGGSDRDGHIPNMEYPVIIVLLCHMVEHFYKII